jgi:predicted nucleic acid-binding Zn ribbon protein
MLWKKCSLSGALMAAKRANQKSFVSIGKVIENILRQQRPFNDQALVEVWDVWERAVGPAIAANARPVAFKGDLLLVHVNSSTWLHHLRFLEKEMIAKINAVMGDTRIRSIKLKVGPF